MNFTKQYPYAAAGAACAVGWVIILVGPFKDKFTLMVLVPGFLLLGIWLSFEYKRGRRSIDAVREKYLPLEARRIKAAEILSEWREKSAEDIRKAIAAIPDSEISEADPDEIAYRAAKNLKNAA